MSSSVVAIIALFATAFSLWAVLAVETRPALWHAVGTYWVCAMVASAAMFGLAPLVIVGGWAVSTAILFIVAFVAGWLAKYRQPPPEVPHHHHSPH